jgi:hypothetical protein
VILHNYNRLLQAPYHLKEALPYDFADLSLNGPYNPKYLSTDRIYRIALGPQNHHHQLAERDHPEIALRYGRLGRYLKNQ